MKQLSKPFGLLLMWLYEFVGNYGLAIILFAIIVKLIFLPFMAKSKQGSLKLLRLQPQMKALQKRHGGNQQKYNEEVQKLYRENNCSPTGGCIWSIIPFPILIALYYAIRCPLTTMMGLNSSLLAPGGALHNLLYTADGTALFTNVRAGYAEISQAHYITENWDIFKNLGIAGLKQLDYTFLGMNLGETPLWNFLWKTNWHDISVWLPGLGLFLIPFITTAFTYLSNFIMKRENAKITGPKEGTETDAEVTSDAMMMMMPLMTLWFGFIMPAALSIYWLVGTVLGIIQDYILSEVFIHRMAKEDASVNFAAKEREIELEAKRKETERLKAENATVINPSTSKRKQQQIEKAESASKAVEWERKKASEEHVQELSRVENRRYARGRAYDPGRFNPNKNSADASVEESIPQEQGPESVE